jgi:DNA-binding transcriptional LysR family regulator
MDFDTARFRAFLQVAERGTVAAAADALGYTAPAVSQQIGKLEAQLGVRLFDRVGGRLRLSPRGKQLVPVARQFLDLSIAAEHPGPAPTQHAHVIIAGFASALRALVVPLLSSRIAKRTTFDVRESEDEVALRDLRLGHVDIAITQEYDGAPIVRSDRLTYTPLLTDRLRLIAPPSWPTSVRLAELAEIGWLVNGAGTRCEEATTQVLKTAGITPRITGHIADNHALLALVAAGHGATIAPQLVIAGGPTNATVARVDLGVARTIFGVTRSAVSANYADVLRQLAVAGRAALRAR